MPRVASHRPDCGDICCIGPVPTSESLDEVAFQRSSCAAAIAGNLLRLQQLVSKNPIVLHDDGYGGSSGYTPLHYAAREGHAHIVDYLLQQGADPNAVTTAGKATPLHRAAFAGRLECVELLLKDERTDVGFKDADGKTAMDKAQQQGHARIAALLLEATKPKR